MGVIQRGWDLASGKVSRENKERFEEAQKIVENAKERYEHTTQTFEAMRISTQESLQSFGKYQLKCLSTDIRGYVESYSHFANLEYGSNLPVVADYNLPMNSPQYVQALTLSSRTAFDLVTTNALSAGAGALAAVGVYGCGVIAGTAKAGTAIASLSALAKGKAVLSWMGGGSMLGGITIIGGAAFAGFNVVSGLLNEAKSKEKLAEAKSIVARVDKEIANLKTGISFCCKLKALAEDYQDFLQEFAKLFKPMLKKLQEIEAREANGTNTTETGMIDFQSLPEDEKRALHISWLMVQIYNKLLKTPLLNDKEDIAAEAQSALVSARNTQKQLLPSLIELADNGTVDIAFARETKAARVTEKWFIVLNWGITALAALCAICSFAIENIAILLPERTLFATGLIAASLIACPRLSKYKEKDFTIGGISQKKKHALMLVFRFLIAMSVFGVTFYFCGVRR